MNNVFILFLLLGMSLRCQTKPLSVSNHIHFELESLSYLATSLDSITYFRYSSYKKGDSVGTTLIYDYRQKGWMLLDLDKQSTTYLSADHDQQQIIQSAHFSLNNNSEKYYLFNEDGKVYAYENDSFVLVDDLNKIAVLQEHGLIPNTMFGIDTDVEFQNDSIIVFPNLIDYDSKNYKRKYHRTKMFPLFTVYDIKNKRGSLLNYHLKDEYFLNRPKRKNLQFRVVGDTLFVHYMFSEKVDLFSIKENKMLAVLDLKSKYQTVPIAFLKNDKNSFENERYGIEQGYYGSLIYNPYKKCYYRVFYHALPRKNAADEFTIYTDKSSSIIVFDEDLKWQGEYKFESNHFIFLGLTPTKEGVILNSHFTETNGIKYLKHD